MAIRAGMAPDQPDNVVQPFYRMRMALVGTEAYFAQNGKPETEDDLKGHRFVAPDNMDTRAPFYRWLYDRVDANSMVFRMTEEVQIAEAVLAGAGLGFVPHQQLALDSRLVEIIPSEDAWTAQLWIVTHVDLHRTTKVQTFLNFLKSAAKEWN